MPTTGSVVAVQQLQPREGGRRARAGEDHAPIAEHVDERLGADNESAHVAAAAQAGQQRVINQAGAGTRALRVGQPRSDVVAEGCVATRQRADCPGTARAERLPDRRGSLQTTLDAAQADAQSGASRGAASRVEGALLDERVDARARDPEAASGFSRR